nr:MAG TPA: hypothetical protein [Caudoviricetes sp.]
MVLGSSRLQLLKKISNLSPSPRGVKLRVINSKP